MKKRKPPMAIKIYGTLSHNRDRQRCKPNNAFGKMLADHINKATASAV